MENLGLSVYLLLAVKFTSIVVIVHLVYMDHLDHLRKLVQSSKEAGDSIMAVIRGFPRGGAIYINNVVKQIRQTFLSHFHQMRFENFNSVDKLSNGSQESDKPVDRFNRPDELNKVDESGKPVISNVYLKGGGTIEIDWQDADDYIKNNRDKVEYRKINVRRPPIEE